MVARYENLKSLKDEQFRRLTGVKRHTFNRMLEILQEALHRKMALGGRPPQLSDRKKTEALLLRQKEATYDQESARS